MGLLLAGLSMDFNFVKIAVFVPVTHAQKMRDVLAEGGAGKLGDYDSCSFSSRGMGRFRPLKGAKPFTGEIGKVEETEEEKIEVLCAHENVEKILKVIKAAHPYEEPAIDVYPLLILP